MDYKAKLVIHKANRLTPRQAWALGKWLRKLSYMVEDEYSGFSKRFTARYMK